MDLVADLRYPPAGAAMARRAAIDLTEDPSILTAIANDIGTEEIFQRQVIAYGREGDAAIAFSTSGGSREPDRGPRRGARRGLLTIALGGYDGGRIAAEGLADHVIVTRSQHIPRIQEAQASAYHVLRELLELAAGPAVSSEATAPPDIGERPALPMPHRRRPRGVRGRGSAGRCRASAFAPSSSGSPPSSGSTASSSTTSAAS